MFQFFHHLLNPHCSECRIDAQEKIDRQREEEERNRVCDSCEILNLEIARLRIDNEKLLDRLLDKPTTEQVQIEPPAITRPAVIPWKVKREMLETEDRAKARAMREAAKPDNTPELEKELGIVERNAEGTRQAEQK